MRINAKFGIIAAMTCAVLNPAAYAQDESPKRTLVDTKVPGPDVPTRGITDAFVNIPNIEAVEEEIQIMAKVLEESIDNAGIEDWKGRRGLYSTFDPSIGGHIQGRYVPSVGALFVIPVAFPLRADGPHPEDDRGADTAEPDLWEKNQRSSATYRIGKRMPVVAADKNVRVKIVSPDSVVIDEDITVDIETIPQTGTKTFVKRGSGGGRVGGGGGFGGGGSHGGGLAFGGGGGNAGTFNILFAGQEFDEEKVTKLGAALIESVAEYGHRMEHLKPDERIFVIVESGAHEPRSLDLLFGPNFTPLHTQSLVRPFGRSTAKYQIVVRKRDLTEKTTAKALKGKIEKTEY